MSLQQMKWAKVKRLSAETGLPLVTAAVRPDGRFAMCVTADGAVWEIDRRGEYPPEPSHWPTTSIANYIKDHDAGGLSVAWLTELDRRIAEVAA